MLKEIHSQSNWWLYIFIIARPTLLLCFKVDAVAATDRTADARATDDSPHSGASPSDKAGNHAENVEDADVDETDTDAENEEFDGERLESDATNDGEDETEEDLREDERFDSDATEDDDEEYWNTISVFKNASEVGGGVRLVQYSLTRVLIYVVICAMRIHASN